MAWNIAYEYKDEPYTILVIMKVYYLNLKNKVFRELYIFIQF